MRYLDAEELLLIHYQLIERYGGSHGTRSLPRIKSAAIAPAQEVFDIEQYPTIYDKAAVYARNIIQDHPFHDGNKRTGITVAIQFLELNGQEFTAVPGEIEDFAVRIATDKLGIEIIAQWLQDKCA